MLQYFTYEYIKNYTYMYFENVNSFKFVQGGAIISASLE